MKSLYGTIINHSPRSLFDIQHIYPNAQMMHNSTGTDGVPVYGYVLVYYGEPTEELYVHNLSTDQVYGSNEVSVDYNKTVWQKRPDYINGGTSRYFSIARLNSVLPYTQEVALKGYENQIVFQRLNAFPLQGEIGYYYNDFGTTSTEYEVIHFDNEAMEEFNTKWPSITPVAKYSNLYAANEDINNTSINIGDYILISYSDDEKDYYNNETVQEYIDKEHSEDYITNQLIDQNYYGNNDELLYILHHQMIFQKQEINGELKYILSSNNRLKLEKIIDEGIVLTEGTDSSYSFAYDMSSDNSRNLQEKMEFEISRTETIMAIARENIEITQSIIKTATDDMLINSENILEQKELLDEEQKNIQNNVDLIKQYKIDTEIELSGMNEDVENIAKKIESVNSALKDLKDNTYSSFLTISNNIEKNNNEISNELINTITPNLDNIVNESNRINELVDNLNTFIQSTVGDANSKLKEYQTALNDANIKITSAINNTDNAITNLNTNIDSLTDASYNITISNNTIDTNVTALNALTTVDTIGTYTAEIAIETAAITEQLNILSTLETNLQSISNNILTPIKNLTVITDPTYTDFNTSTIPSDIKSCSDIIQSYITNNIKDCINNKINIYITNIINLIESMNNQLITLNSIHSDLITLNNDIKVLNDSILDHKNTLSNYLTERLQVYYIAIETSKNKSLEYSNNIKNLEDTNIELTKKIQIYLQVNIEQSELLNIITDEYALYFGMWNWYGYVFLPSIKTITIEDVPSILKYYNTDTLEYPTK